MGPDDRDAVRMLRDADDPAFGSEELIRRFYTRSIAIDISARDGAKGIAPICVPGADGPRTLL